MTSDATIPLNTLPRSPRFTPQPDIEDVFPNAHAQGQDDEPISTLLASSKPPLWKRELYALLEHPTSSPAAFVFHIFSTGLIILSALVTILETVPAFHEISGGIWFGVETSLVALFTIEYIARCIAWSLSWKMLLQWIGSFFGIIDLLAIVPYYVEIALHQDTSLLFRFSILRTFRLLRVFRPFRYNNVLLLTIEVMYLSFRRSQHALLALSFFVAMVLIVFSTLLYFIERGTWDATLETFVNTDGDPSQFASIPAAGWFVIVTITTVGYGEITPRSILGRLITLPLLIFGLLLIALPSFVLGREFSIVWNEMMKDNDAIQVPLTSRSIPSSPAITRRDSSNNRLNRRTMPYDINTDAEISSLGDPTSSRPIPSQSDLSRQIADLRTIVESQGQMLKAFLQREGVGPRTT